MAPPSAAAATGPPVGGGDHGTIRRSACAASTADIGRGLWRICYGGPAVRAHARPGDSQMDPKLLLAPSDNDRQPHGRGPPTADQEQTTPRRGGRRAAPPPAAGAAGWVDGGRRAAYGSRSSHGGRSGGTAVGGPCA